MKRPAYQFYPGDEEKEGWVNLVSMGAVGLWQRMKNFMHLTGEPYGHLATPSGPLTPARLAAHVGKPVAEVEAWLAELEAERVFTRTYEGVIYSRRMVRDEATREAKARAGAEGGAKPKHTGKQNGSRRPSKRQAKPKAEGQAEPQAKRGSFFSRLSAFPPSGEKASQEAFLPEGGANGQHAPHVEVPLCSGCNARNVTAEGPTGRLTAQLVHESSCPTLVRHD